MYPLFLYDGNRRRGEEEPAAGDGVFLEKMSLLESRDEDGQENRVSLIPRRPDERLSLILEMTLHSTTD